MSEEQEQNMNQEELKKKFMEKLQDEYFKRRESQMDIYNEIQAFNHAINSSFFEISQENDLSYSWSADLIKSKINLKLD